MTSLRNELMNVITIILFQGHLQTLFDWQVDLDKLNVRAQTLLETCADTRISNGITQITTKYNALLSLAKEVMKRLELHYQVTIVILLTESYFISGRGV